MSRRFSRLDWLILAAVAVHGAGVPSHASAQGQHKVTFSFQIQPGPKSLDPFIYLRPNNSHSILFFLKNDDENPLKKALIRLERVEGGEIIAETERATVPSGAEIPLKFVKAKEEPKAKEDKDADGRWTGPHQDLRFVVLDEQNKEVAQHKLFLRHQHPSKYVTARGTYDREARKISFDVTLARDPLGTAPCVVQLVLDPVFIPGLKLPIVKKALRAELKVVGQTSKLFAEELEFEGATKLARKDARVFLTVDDFRRAYEFKTDLDQSGVFNPVVYDVEKPAIRFRVPRFALPIAKFPVTLEADGPTDKLDSLELGLDRTGLKDPDQFEPERLPGLRDMRVKLEVGPKGQILCKTDVQDWTVIRNTEQVSGKTVLRVRVLDKEGKPKVLDQEAPRLLSGARAGIYAPLQAESNQIFAEVTLDESRPEDAQFQMVKEWAVGKPVLLSASAKKRTDLQAPIHKVVFVQGKLPDDGKIDPKADKYDVKDPEKSTSWAATIGPFDKPGKVDVAVLIETATGVKAVVNDAVIIVDPESGAGKAGSKKLAIIRGVLSHGMRLEPNADVYLFDAKDKKEPKESAKTNAKGEFVFVDVPDGAYILYAVVTNPLRHAMQNIVVKGGKFDPGKGKKVLELKLLAK